MWEGAGQAMCGQGGAPAPTCCCWKCKSSAGLISPLLSAPAAATAAAAASLLAPLATGPAAPGAPGPLPVLPPPSACPERLPTPFCPAGADLIVSEADSTIMSL